ncbi:hypothetical protein F4782DRAFT_482318 [Xylaria castorea]|nr:hypothetical protein F4782DRAFT_482318 [Xylaria castorea]
MCSSPWTFVHSLVAVMCTLGRSFDCGTSWFKLHTSTVSFTISMSSNVFVSFDSDKADPQSEKFSIKRAACALGSSFGCSFCRNRRVASKQACRIE